MGIKEGKVKYFKEYWLSAFPIHTYLFMYITVWSVYKDISINIP